MKARIVVLALALCCINAIAFADTPTDAPLAPNSAPSASNTQGKKADAQQHQKNKRTQNKKRTRTTEKSADDALKSQPKAPENTTEPDSLSL